MYDYAEDDMTDHEAYGQEPWDNGPSEYQPEDVPTSWGAVDLIPYIQGTIVMPEPGVLTRTDGAGLFYPGRVNSLYGTSESCKSWIALYTCMQAMERGERVTYLDFEDSPEGIVSRLRTLGVADSDLIHRFRYIQPQGPLAEMQRSKYGKQVTDAGKRSSIEFANHLEEFEPDLIIADGMTMLYGLHGHDTNDASGTDVITTWLKQLCNYGQTTVIVIDHTGKTGGAGASPIGAHHKVAMIQGTALRVDVATRPVQGGIGRLNLVVYKDRPGGVRKVSSSSSEQVAGVVIMDSSEGDRLRMYVEPPTEGDVVIGDSEAMERKLAQVTYITQLFEDAKPLFAGAPDGRVSSSMVAKATGATLADVRSMWELAESSGSVKAYGAGRGRFYILI